LHHGDGEEGSVELAVASAGQAVPPSVATRCGDRRDAGVRGECGGIGLVPDVSDLAQDLPGDQCADAWDREKVRVCFGKFRCPTGSEYTSTFAPAFAFSGIVGRGPAVLLLR
jgi:hypothetical protein